MDVDELVELKKDLEKIGKDIDQDKGAYNQLIESLKEFDFTTVKEAENELKRLFKLIEDKEKEFENNLNAIQKEIDTWED